MDKGPQFATVYTGSKYNDKNGDENEEGGDEPLEWSQLMRKLGYAEDEEEEGKPHKLSKEGEIENSDGDLMDIELEQSDSESDNDNDNNDNDSDIQSEYDSDSIASDTDISDVEDVIKFEVNEEEQKRMQEFPRPIAREFWYNAALYPPSKLSLGMYRLYVFAYVFIYNYSKLAFIYINTNFYSSCALW